MSEYRIIGAVSILTKMGPAYTGAIFKDDHVSNKELLKTLLEKGHIEKLGKKFSLSKEKKKAEAVEESSEGK